MVHIYIPGSSIGFSDVHAIPGWSKKVPPPVGLGQTDRGPATYREARQIWQHLAASVAQDSLSLSPWDWQERTFRPTHIRAAREVGSPTSNALSTSFRLSSDAGILLLKHRLSIRNRHGTCKNVCATCTYFSRASIFACWWLGGEGKGREGGKWGDTQEMLPINPCITFSPVTWAA